MIEIMVLIVCIVVYIITSMVSYRLLKGFFEDNDEDGIMNASKLAKNLCRAGPIALIIWIGLKMEERKYKGD